MIPAWLPVAVPWAGAALLAALPRRPAPLGPAVAAVSLAAAAALVFGGGVTAAERRPLDALGAALLLSGAAAAFLAALAGAAAERGEEERFAAAGLPLLQGAQALALLAADPVVAWIGLALGAGAGAALVALGSGRRGAAAAWVMLLLCGSGLAMALLGSAMLGARGAAGAAGLPGLGFVLLLLGYGSLAGLAPMGGWLPRAVAVSPPAVAAALPGLLAPAALHAVLRAASAVGPEAGALPPAGLLVAFGSAAAVLTAPSAWLRRGGAAAREGPGRGTAVLAGLAAVGFGLGGAAGTAAGVLLLLGLPFSVGAAVFGAAGGGPAAAALGRVSLAGLPPFAPFAGLALLFAAVAALPAGAALPLGAALLAAVAAQLRGLSPAVRAASEPGRGGLLLAGSAWLSLGLALALGAALPEAVAAALAGAAGSAR